MTILKSQLKTAGADFGAARLKRSTRRKDENTRAGGGAYNSSFVSARAGRRCGAGTGRTVCLTGKRQPDWVSSRNAVKKASQNLSRQLDKERT
jgi:hypothetical protein